ncbi:MAG: alanine racemase [Proteobacteria bacterium]|nr:alanine racemase [Pseudomonadota bacterium]
MDGAFYDNLASQPTADDVAAGALTIDLGALRQNYLVLKAHLPQTNIAAVVKADAYGLGMAQVAPSLFDAGCRDFFVAQLGEALALRWLLPKTARIFALNGLQPGTELSCASAEIIPVLNSLDQAKRWSTVAQELGAKLPAALQFDTGMARLGLSESETEQLIGNPSLLDDVDVLFLLSHLASADEPENGQNSYQVRAVQNLALRFPGLGVCLANSAGIFLDLGHKDIMARPGLALYGGAPITDSPNPMRPVVRLDVGVIQTRDVPAGTRVGYGGSYVTGKSTSIATIAAGYADGLPHQLSNRGAVFFDDTRLPIVGRVSMDTITIDVSALPPGTLQPGSMVEIIGPHQTLEDVAANAGTISYEILTRLGRRYRRHYC